MNAVTAVLEERRRTRGSHPRYQTGSEERRLAATACAENQQKRRPSTAAVRPNRRFDESRARPGHVRIPAKEQPRMSLVKGNEAAIRTALSGNIPGHSTGVAAAQPLT